MIRVSPYSWYLLSIGCDEYCMACVYYCSLFAILEWLELLASLRCYLIVVTMAIKCSTLWLNCHLSPVLQECCFPFSSQLSIPSQISYLVIFVAVEYLNVAVGVYACRYVNSQFVQFLKSVIPTSAKGSPKTYILIFINNTNIIIVHLHYYVINVVVAFNHSNAHDAW